MTLAKEIERAENGIIIARKALRSGHQINDDPSLDHWAHRLVFWLEELKRLNKIAEAE